MKKRNKYLKGASVLLIAVLMVSSVAVTADTEDDIRIRNRQTSFADSFAEVGYTYIESDPSAYLHNTGGPVIFDQQPIPDDSTGHGPFSDAGTGFRVYENFWGLSEDIYDVHWWGLWGYGSGLPTVGDVFEISFCADNGGIPDYNNHIVDFTGLIGTEISYVGTGNFYWGFELYYMEMDLPAPVSMASGWVSFYKTTINAQSFAWIDALTGDGNAYQKNMGSLVYDLAFELTGAVPEPILSVNVTGGFGLTATVTNSGDADATIVKADFTLTGGFFLLPPGGVKTGVTVGTGTVAKLGGTGDAKCMVFGIGKPTVTVNVTCAEGVTASATFTPTFVFLFFVL